MNLKSSICFLLALSAASKAGEINGQVTALGLPVQGAKIVLYAGGSTGGSDVGAIKADSALSDSTGMYVIPAGGNNPNSGSISLLATRSGYHFAIIGSAAATTSPQTRNFVLSRDDSSSVITGKVLRASDNSPVVNASVTRSGKDEPRSVNTDSTGTYRFFGIATGNGYNVAALASGYLGASLGGISVAWNETKILPNFLLQKPMGTVSGVIRRSDSTTQTLAGAKIVFYANGTKVDSVFTDISGAFTDSLPATSSPYSVKVTLADYRSPAGAISLDTSVVVNFSQTSVLNLYLTPAAKFKTTITGRVLFAQGSLPAVGASVALAKGPLDESPPSTTDSQGYYRFAGSLMSSGIYRVAVNFAGYASASVGDIVVDSNSIVTVNNIYLVKNIGTLTGVVRRADSTAKLLADAKVVFSINGLNVDSTISDGAGNYTINLNAATYTVKASLPDYRGYKGTSTLDTLAVINFNQTTILHLYLTPATGTIYGIVSHTTTLNPPCAAGGVDSARVYLERRRGTGSAYATWTLIDSGLTGNSGSYSFTGLVPATGGTTPPVYGTSYDNPGGQYRVLVNSAFWGRNYAGNDIIGSASPNTFYTVAFAPNSMTRADFNIPMVLAKSSVSAESSAGGCGTGINPMDRHALNFGTSDKPRLVNVYDLKGAFRRTFILPAGESKVNLPEGVAPGSLLLVK